MSVSTPTRRARFVRPATLLVVVVLAAASLAVGAAGAGAASSDDESLTVGSKDFAGAQAVSQAYGQALEAKGFDVSFQDNIGATEVVYPALLDGEIDAYGEFQGTLLLYLGGKPTGDATETYAALVKKLAGTGIVASKPAPAVDVNGFYVTRATAKKYKLKTLSDLAEVSDKLSFGGPPECSERDQCLGDLSQQLYDFKFSDVKKLDVGGPITAQALEDGDIDVGLLFTGSSVIPKGAVLLTDDKQLQSADNVVFLIRKDKATPKLLKAVNAVSQDLSTVAYNKMAVGVTENKDDPSDVAQDFLDDNDLG